MKKDKNVELEANTTEERKPTLSEILKAEEAELKAQKKANRAAAKEAKKSDKIAAKEAKKSVKAAEKATKEAEKAAKKEKKEKKNNKADDKFIETTATEEEAVAPEADAVETSMETENDVSEEVTAPKLETDTAC